MTAIRLKKPWKIWGVGHVIPEMPEGQASLLIGRGIAELETKVAPARVREVLTAGKNYVTKTARG